MNSTLKYPISGIRYRITWLAEHTECEKSVSIRIATGDLQAYAAHRGNFFQLYNMLFMKCCKCNDEWNGIQTRKFTEKVRPQDPNPEQDFARFAPFTFFAETKLTSYASHFPALFGLLFVLRVFLRQFPLSIGEFVQDFVGFRDCDGYDWQGIQAYGKSEGMGRQPYRCSKEIYGWKDKDSLQPVFSLAVSQEECICPWSRGSSIVNLCLYLAANVKRPFMWRNRQGSTS